MNRSRLCFYVILLTPLLVFWQTIFHEYAFRDDYSHLREAREEPGKLVKHTTSQGRPLYGALLESTFQHAGTVEHLQWLRLLSVTFLTLVALALWRQLYGAGWHEFEAAALGLGIVLLPAGQITAAWAIGWPYALGLLLAVAGFVAVEAELERGGLKRWIGFLGGCLIYLLAASVYQSNALFAVVLIAATMLLRSGREQVDDTRWLGTHLSALFAGLLGSYLLTKFLFSTGLFFESARLQFEHAPFSKLAWFVWQPLFNSTALFALRDDFGAGAGIFWLAAVAGLAAIGGARKFLPDERTRKKWLICVAFLPFVAHAVSLVAAERAIGYRVLFPLSGLALVLVFFTLRTLRETQRIHRRVEYGLIGALLVVAALSARHQAWTLLAEPQGKEWVMIRGAVLRHSFKGATKIYVITPTPEDRTTRRMFADEFGSLSSDSDWAPREMVRAAIYERFGGQPPTGVTYQVILGRNEPSAGEYQLVVDMRKLRALRAE